MLKRLVLMLVLLQISVGYADESPKTKSISPDEIANLLNRIDQLENRIKELEQNATRLQPPVAFPNYSPFGDPHSQPHLPHIIPVPKNTPAPFSSTPFVPPTTPAAPYPQPNHPNKNVPDSWKPFHFNGMQYYIIPIDEAERMIRLQGGEKTNR